MSSSSGSINSTSGSGSGSIISTSGSDSINSGSGCCLGFLPLFLTGATSGETSAVLKRPAGGAGKGNREMVTADRNAGGS